MALFTVRWVHIRRPRIDYESHLDRNELGALLVTAGLASPRDHDLVSLLALNGLLVRRIARRAGIGKRVGHDTLLTHSSPQPWMPACRCAGRLYAPALLATDTRIAPWRTSTAPR